MLTQMVAALSNDPVELACAVAIGSATGAGSLLLRYDRRRPFGSKRSTCWSLLVVLVISVVATAVGRLGLQPAVAGAGPLYSAVVLPPLLLATRRVLHVSNPDRLTSSPALLKIASLGIVPMLRKLEDIMDEDRAAWIGVTDPPCRGLSVETIEARATSLHSGMQVRFRGDAGRLHAATTHYSDLVKLIRKAEAVRVGPGASLADRRNRRRLRIDICMCYLMLRGEAYDLKYVPAATLSPVETRKPPPGQERADTSEAG